MSNYEEENSVLSDEEVYAIQDDYRQQRLVESLVGPVGSTLFHVVLVVLLAFLIQDQYKEEQAAIKMTAETIIPIDIPKPEPVDVPELIPVDTDTPVPDVTPIAIEASIEKDSPLDEVSDKDPTVDELQPQEMTDVISDPSVTPASTLVSRGPDGRSDLVEGGGGTPEGQVHLVTALHWLKKVQEPDGSWGIKNKQAYTGLALLTFLAHGDTHLSKEFGPTVRNAMQWLTYDKISKKHGNGYGHAIKTYALAEAYAMTGIPFLEEAMNKCIRIVIDGQQKGGSYHYNYNLNEGEKQDLSVAGWNYQALKAAYGAGCQESGLVGSIQKAVSWLKRHGAGDDSGNGFPYNAAKSSTGKKHTMRAVGVLCLQLYGEGDFPAIKDEIQVIATQDLARLDFNNPPQESLYGWYYATQAMFQQQGKEWKAWNKKFQRELSKSQHSEGYWEYPGKFHGETNDATTDRVYATTLCALMLTVYYRYLPSTQKVLQNKVTTQKRDKEIEELNLIE